MMGRARRWWQAAASAAGGVKRPPPPLTLACARAAGGSALGRGQRTACAAVTHALSTLQLQFAARMQGARDASAGSEAMRAHCHANRKEKRRCRGSDSRKKPKNQARCALPLGLLVPHLGCPAAARHDAGNEHVGGEEGEDRRRDGRAQDRGEKKRRRLLGRWGRAAPGAGGEGGGGGGGDGEEDDGRTAIAKI